MQKITTRASGFCLFSLVWMPLAQAAEIGANAVQKFGTCAGNLSQTLGDAAGFRDSRPGDLVSNFLFLDDNVWQQDWTTADYTGSGDTATGFAGADSSMITYLSSHGQSSNGVYYGSLSQAQGCSFSNSSMHLGDAKNRYLFLSTCYGLMLGTGKYLPEHPNHSAEDLQKVWNKGLAGTRCIYSYGTVSVDNPNYGKNFWDRWKQAGVTNTDAFLNASWAISSRQQPVVMCFGRDYADADAKLAETVFSYDPSAYGYNIWTWYDPVAYRAAPVAAFRMAEAPRLIAFSRRHAEGVSSFAPDVRRGSQKTVSTTSGERALALATENVMSTSKGWRYVKPGASMAARVAVASDQAAIRIARQSLDQLRLRSAADDLKVAYVRHQKTANSANPKPTIVGRTVVFEQPVVAGYTMLGDDGKIFVSLDAAGEVRAIEDNRIEAIASAEVVRSQESSVSAEEAEGVLRDMAAKKWPVAEILYGPIEIGYVAADNNTARLIARMSLTATQGEFSKADEVSVPLR